MQGSHHLTIPNGHIKLCLLLCVRHSILQCSFALQVPTFHILYRWPQNPSVSVSMQKLSSVRRSSSPSNHKNMLLCEKDTSQSEQATKTREPELVRLSDDAKESIDLVCFCLLSFYRAMHCSAKRGIAIACRLSVCLSVCNVGGLWSHRLEFFENNFIVS